MRLPFSRFLIADKPILKFHRKAEAFCSFVNKISKENNDGSARLSAGALYSILADSWSIHKSILSMCCEGWAFTCPILLRTMMDMLVSVGIIVNDRGQSEYQGFKYTHSFLKAEYININEKQEKKRKSAIEFQIKDGINNLPDAYKSKALDFMFKEKLYSYWFCPEFDKPSDAIKALSSSMYGLNDLYRRFSGSTHGGFLGLRLCRDNPDDLIPKPTADRKGQNLALIGSSRVLLEMCRLRESFEVGGMGKIHQNLMEEFRGLEKHIST